MIYVGMDVSFKSFVIYAMNERKKKLFEGEISADKEGLLELLKKLGNEQKLFVFEAGNQMKWIALFLKNKPTVNIHVVHPNEIQWISQSSGKTDRIDARKLSELARMDALPKEVHIVEGEVRKLRELISARSQLQSKRVALSNTLRGLAGQEGIRLPEKFFQAKNWKEVLIKKVKGSETFRQIVLVYMEAIDAMVKAEQKLVKEITCIEDKRIDLLKTIPAIGELSSRVLLSAIDHADRFESQKGIANYGGLTPRIYQSGSVTQLGRINKDGRSEVRKVLLQCAHTIARMKSPAVRPLKDFFERVQKKRNKKIATVALARKLLTTAYGVLKSNEAYDPKKLLAYA